MKRHRKTAQPGESERFEESKILVKDTSSIGFNCTFDNENYYAKDMLIVRKKKPDIHSRVDRRLWDFKLHNDEMVL